MTQFNLSYRISAKDGTRQTLSSALSGVTRFARLASKPITIPLRVGRTGLAFLRDVNLGLRPLVAALDNVIDRGARLEVVSKSFQSLTGKNAAQASRLAKELVVAASGTVKLSKAMEIANRALGSGIDLSQLTTAIEFISKKAITTGKNAELSLEKVITGLSRGSTLFLDDFGILVDGIDGVRRSFDKIKGIGAFDSLGPAKQKAEIIRQAIAEMRVQMGKIGVSGKETIFVFQGIKNALSDSVDKLVAAIAKSKALKEVLQKTRDIISGISEFFDKGGSFIDLLFGDKGQGNGLLDVLKEGILDIGENLGRVILGGFLVAISKIPDLFTGLGKGIIAIFDSGFLQKIPGKIQTGLKFVITDIIPAIKVTLDEFIDSLRKFVPFKNFPKVDQFANPPTLSPGKPTTPGTSPDFDKFIKQIKEDERKEQEIRQQIRQRSINGTLGPPLIEVLPKSKTNPKSTPVATGPGPAGFGGGSLAVALAGALTQVALGGVSSGPTDRKNKPPKPETFGITKRLRRLNASAPTPKSIPQGQPPKTQSPKTTSTKAKDIGDLLSQAGDEGRALLGKTGFPRTRQAVDRFIKRNPPFKKQDNTPLKIDLIPAELTDRGRRIRKRKLLGLNRELRQISRETGRIERQTTRDARRRAGIEVRRQRKLGFKIDRPQAERQIFDKLFGERTAKQRERIKQINKEISGAFPKPPKDSQAAVPNALNTIIQANKDATIRIEQSIEKLADIMSVGIKAIAGTERNIKSAGAPRT